MFNKKFGLSLILSVTLISTSLTATAFASDKEVIKEEKAAIIQELQQDKNINIEEIDENNIIITSPEKTDENYDKKESINKLEKSMLEIQYIDEELEELNENKNSRRKRSIEVVHHDLDAHNSKDYSDGEYRVKLKSDVAFNARGKTKLSGHAYGIWDGNKPAETDSMKFKNTFTGKGPGIEFTGGVSGWTVKPGTTSATISKIIRNNKRHLIMHDYSGINLDGLSLSITQTVACDFVFGDITYSIETRDSSWT